VDGARVAIDLRRLHEGANLVPGSGGQFEVEVNGDMVFSKKQAGRYPEIKELKEAINRLLE
jgi:selenoprotein W-related protein